MCCGGLSMRRVLMVHFADCCILNTTKETETAESTRVERPAMRQALFGARKCSDYGEQIDQR